jgi:homoserine acetyltransferase
VIGVTSDILFPAWQQRELAETLSKVGSEVTYVELDAPYGHDTFLIEKQAVGGAIRTHIE